MVNVREVDLGSRTIRILELEDARDSETGKSVTGAWVWDASLVFAAWLGAHGKAWPDGSIKDLRVLELGAGLGVVGLAAAALGARVLLTDRDIRCIRGIRRNIAENALEGRAFAAQLEWGEGLPRQVHPGEELPRRADSGEDAQRRTSGSAELVGVDREVGGRRGGNTGARGDGGSEGEREERERDTGAAGLLSLPAHGAGACGGACGGACVGGCATTAAAVDTTARAVRASGEQAGAEAPLAETLGALRALSVNGGEGGVAESEPLDVEDFVKDLDLIVGSDITYEADQMPALCHTIKQLAGPRTRIFFSPSVFLPASRSRSSLPISAPPASPFPLRPAPPPQPSTPLPPPCQIFIAVELRSSTPECFQAMAAQGLTWGAVEQGELDPRWCSDDIKIFQLFTSRGRHMEGSGTGRSGTGRSGAGRSGEERPGSPVVLRRHQDLPVLHVIGGWRVSTGSGAVPSGEVPYGAGPSGAGPSGAGRPGPLLLQQQRQGLPVLHVMLQ
ncbi:unnamed protein product [Closterium sp. NIES-54]